MIFTSITSVTARFAHTEAATDAARRVDKHIRGASVSIKYVGRRGEEGAFINEMPYSATMDIPATAPLFNAYGILGGWNPPVTNVAEAEITDECAVGVLTDNESARRVREIFYNGGGYDVTTEILE